MGYSNPTLVDRILAQSLTSATNPTSNNPLSLMEIGNQRDRNNVSDDIVNQYISWADHEIDASLSEMYQTPLSEMADFEANLDAVLDVYNQYVVLDRASPLEVGDTIILSDGIAEATAGIEEIIDNTMFQLDSIISYEFPADTTRVIRIKFPDPIPLISARYAAANIYDKYLMGESAPQQSSYGTMLRKLAQRDLNNVLRGITILHGQRRIGYRFKRPELEDRYRLPDSSADADKSIEKVE